MRIFRLALAASLALSALLYFFWSWHWPLVGDASLMHYIAFLIERGWAPYRDIGDMDMPGAFLTELAAMHLFGYGALAWRLFDFTLLGVASASFAVITHRPELDRGWSRLAALFAASLFIVTHGRDGLYQGGQRDLTMAVLLIAATAFLFVAVRKGSSWPAAAFGLLSGIAVTIKPTTLPLTVLQLALAVYVVRGARVAFAPLGRSRDSRSILIHYVVPSALAYLVAPAIALGFLLREHALSAFLVGLHSIVPYYASLGHRPLSYLLLHSVSPLLSLVLLWLALLAFDGALLRSPRESLREWLRDWERTALLLGVLLSLASCVVQARALPYHRYPLLAFLLPLVAIDCAAALQSATLAGTRARAARLLAFVTLAVGGFYLAPQSAVLIHRDRWWQNDFISSLEQNLNALGGPALSGHIQCIDSNSGCGNVLYLMRLEPSNGVLLDILLFGPGNVPTVRDTRAEFTRDLAANPPRVIVVTSSLYLSNSENFHKLDLWPAFAEDLATNYTLQTQWSPSRTTRWWVREEFPVSYRIYVLRTRP